MAKSTRSKVKRHFRAKKRTEGVYAATEAARLHRLHQKLKALTTAEPDDGADADEEGDTAEGEQMDADAPSQHTDAAGAADGQPSGSNANGGDAMDLDSGSGAASSSTSTQRISTHGPRNSRREQWRASKGLPPRPKAKGMNRQGGVAARRKAGRSHRRR
ncbi:hypothetical protein C8Q77DRAFT_1088104 [Trametes polyzona]|nr:hypothetical protein C8Q77DRAFT_1088104 [Trametes polyzona]